MSVGNTLFKPYRRNHCEPSKPLGTWTTRQNAQPDDEDEGDDDD